jgi:hypothetical protein
MNGIELLEVIEREIDFYDNIFVDLHVINDTVVGFYKTQHMKYKNKNAEETSYLFPTTFRNLNNSIHTTVVVGSVERNFEVPTIYRWSNYATKLEILSVQTHLYKLLAITQHVQPADEDYYEGCIGLNIKMIMDSIYQLNEIGFPFMRISNNTHLLIK